MSQIATVNLQVLFFKSCLFRERGLKEEVSYLRCVLWIQFNLDYISSINTTPTEPVTLNGELLEFVENFTYPGSLISKDHGAQKDIKARLGKARCDFAKLQNICKSKQYIMNTVKLVLYNSNV